MLNYIFIYDETNCEVKTAYYYCFSDGSVLKTSDIRVACRLTNEKRDIKTMAKNFLRNILCLVFMMSGVIAFKYGYTDNIVFDAVWLLLDIIAVILIILYFERKRDVLIGVLKDNCEIIHMTKDEILSLYKSDSQEKYLIRRLLISYSLYLCLPSLVYFVILIAMLPFYITVMAYYGIDFFPHNVLRFKKVLKEVNDA